MEQETVESEIGGEYQKAKAEGRQPTCPYCNKSLEIGQFYTIYVQWSWNSKEKAYNKQNPDWQEEKPFCTACETKDWDFIDDELINF
jgi:hypothetical protein